MSWYTDYLKQRFRDQCSYNKNLGQYIATLIYYGYSDSTIFNSGYQNNLLPCEIWKQDKRISQYGLKIMKYPSYQTFLEAVQDLDYSISRHDFNQGYYEYMIDMERFNRIYHRWEYTIRNINRYNMLHEHIMEDRNHGR